MTSNKFILTVTLNPAIDKIVLVDDFAIGREVRANTILQSAGGKGINVSRTLQSLGCMNLATGFIGGASGLFISEQLGREGLAHHCVAIKGESRTSLTIHDQTCDKTSRVLENGPTISKAEQKEFLQTYEVLLNKCKAVVLSGSLPQGVSSSIYAKMVRMANKKGLAVVLDCSKEALVKGIKAKPFLVKPNRQEAEELVGYKLSSIKAQICALKDIQALGAINVVISLDKDGVVAINEQGMICVKAPKVVGSYYVGCGDAFIGGFLKAYYNDRSFEQCVCSGVASGTANLLTQTPGCITKKDMNSLLSSLKSKILKN